MTELNFDQIERDIRDGWIREEKHPTADLRILNYTQKTQYGWHWTPETRACRGLIVNSKNEIVSRPFQKFFSYEQLNGQLPDGSFEVYDKLDGSLLVSYFLDEKIHLATRGSFVSEQAHEANRMLNAAYGWMQLDPACTYLFEFIHPKNRIVVDYGDRKDLVLLAIIRTDTGQEQAVQKIGFPLPDKYDLADLDAVLQTQAPNKEGFVLKYESGERVKIKFDEYKRLHKLLTGVSKKTIWELLSTGKSLDEITVHVPQEFHQWVSEQSDSLLSRFNEVEKICRADFRKDFPTRKNAALYFQTCPYPSVMYKMYDERDWGSTIWKIIRPRNEKPFRCSEE